MDGDIGENPQEAAGGASDQERGVVEDVVVVPEVGVLDEDKCESSGS